MREHIEWQELHELLKELAQKEYGDKYGEQIFWYFQDVIDDSCKLDFLEEENARLNNIIKEVREYIEKYDFITGYYEYNYDDENDTYTHYTVKEDILEILDKENE